MANQQPMFDQLFDEYKQKHGEAMELLDRIAREAEQFSMGAVYGNKGFFRKVDRKEALSVFHDTFMECVKRGLEGETKTLSGCLCFYFRNRLKDYIAKRERDPKPVDTGSSEKGTNTEGLMDIMKARVEGFPSPDPDAGLRTKEIINFYLENLERLAKFQRDAVILNVNGFTHSEIAYFLDVETQKINKGKFVAREKLRKIWHERE